jgi:hypothetical protein
LGHDELRQVLSPLMMYANKGRLFWEWMNLQIMMAKVDETGLRKASFM